GEPPVTSILSGYGLPVAATLAERIPYSYSLLNQVECGARVASAAFTDAVAAALGIDIALLTGPSHVTHMQHGRLASLVRPIRESLALYDLAPGGLTPTRPVAELAFDADRLCQELRATHLHRAARTSRRTSESLVTMATWIGL
ncbi:hypothetical protein ACWD7V_44570, partial [Streptomyces sp. NPDC005143]